MADDINAPKRFSLIGIIHGLMLADNLGDVHDEIMHLCDLAGIERPTGGFESGFVAPWMPSATGGHTRREAALLAEIETLRRERNRALGWEATDG